MIASAERAATVLWAVWYATWLVALTWQATTKVRLKTDMGGMPRALLGAGSILLLFLPSGDHRTAHISVVGWTTQKLWNEPGWFAWGLFAAIACSFAFCWWARLHLGRLWSGFVTVKENHRIIDTGPYGLVRHPIYAGVMFAALMTALIKASPAALTGAALMMSALSRIAKIEEQFLSEQLGAEIYAAYRRKVGMLIPNLK